MTEQERRLEQQMPDDVRQIIETIAANGQEAFAVGGCVRDSLLGREPDDWDITTSARPEQVKEWFHKTIDTGIRHGTVTVMLHGTGYEVTTYRIDGEYEDGRHPNSVEFSSRLEDDLMRRDFTINAMAYNSSRGLVDAFEGREDLEAGRIRCVGDPRERFREDGLRMMRAIRFSAQLGFAIDPETYDAIGEMAPDIVRISMERVQVELLKTLLSDHPETVQKYQKTGLLRDNLPVVDRVLSGRMADKTLLLLKHMPKEPVYRYGALLRLITPDEARDTLRTLKLDNDTVHTVTELVASQEVRIEENEPAVREALFQYGKDFLGLMFRFEEAVIATKEEVVGIQMRSRRLHLQKLQRMYQDIVSRGDCFTIRDLDISGNDLLEYGLQGPAIGQTLEKLLHIVMENPKLNEKETLIAMIDNM